MSQINLQPTLSNETLLLRPIDENDFKALYLAASDPAIWAQHPDPTRYQREAFNERFFNGAIASKSAFVLIDRLTEKIIGSSRYYDWRPEERDIGIGYTFLQTAYWGNGTNAALKALMLDYIFKHVDRVWFHVGEQNHRSRRAVEKLGAVLSHSVPRESAPIPFVQLNYVLDASSYSSRRLQSG